MILRTFVLTVTLVEGASMQPALYSGERLFTSRISYALHEPERGDIVWFSAPYEDIYLVKRITGLPGERIAISGGSVWINGEKLAESYLPQEYTPGSLELTLGEDEYFLLGDNRTDSVDSRIFGAIPIEAIEGKAILRFYPFNKFGALD